MNRREAIAALVSLPEVARISVAPLQPNDVIVIECAGPLSAETAKRIKAVIGDVWPGRKVLVLDQDLHLKVVAGETAR